MRFAGLLVCVLTLLAVACGGGDGDEPSAGGSGAGGGAPTSVGAAPTTVSSTGGGAPTGATAAAGPATGAAAPQADADIDVCALLTKAEVEATLNIAVLDAVVVEDPPYITCSYNNVDFPAIHRVRVAILVLEDNEQAKAVFESTRGPGAVKLEGLGELAAWYDITAALEVVEGKYDITVSVPPIDGQGGQSLAEELALLVVSRMP